MVIKVRIPPSLSLPPFPPPRSSPKIPWKQGTSSSLDIKDQSINRVHVDSLIIYVYVLGPGRDQQDRVTIPSTTTPSERTTNKSERKKAARESHLLAQKSKQGGAGSGTEGGGQGGKINVEEVNESSSKGSSKKRPTENGSVSGDLDRDDRVQGHEVDAGGDVNVVGEEDGRETKKARKGI